MTNGHTMKCRQDDCKHSHVDQATQTDLQNEESTPDGSPEANDLGNAVLVPDGTPEEQAAYINGLWAERRSDFQWDDDLDWIFPVMAANLLATDDPKHAGPSAAFLEKIPKDAPPPPTYSGLQEIIRYNNALSAGLIGQFLLSSKRDHKEIHRLFKRTTAWLRCMNAAGIDPTGAEMKGFFKVGYVQKE